MKKWFLTTFPEINAYTEGRKEAWEAIGLKVELVAYGPNQFAEKYKLGEYDVIACDIQAMSTDAYSVLAPYAALFSGNAMDMASGNYDPIPHVTGFNSEEYNNKMEEVFAQKDRKARAELLHEAEELLCEYMPTMPILFNVDAYLERDISKVDSNAFGAKVFTKSSVSGSKKYVERNTAE